MHTVLGLDLGPNSVGWALIEEQADGGGRLIDCGVRAFPEGVDAFDTAKETSRNEQRRTARMMRRQTKRRVRRRRIVEAALVEAGLLPSDKGERAEILAMDPYPIRAAGLERRLEPFEIGRAIFHLNRRRGFLSLKKVKKSAVEKEVKAIRQKQAKSAGENGQPDEIKKEDDSKMLAAIELLAQRMGDRTLGKMLHDDQQAPARMVDGRPIPTRIRNQHTRRAMLEDEFIRLWEAQRAHHPSLLTEAACFGIVGRQDALRTRSGPPRDHKRKLSMLTQFGLHGLIFFQRKIYWPREAIGMCELEKHQRRCPRADRHAQRFRILQELNNIRYTEPGRFQERALNDEQRATLLERLGRSKELSFDQIRKELGLIDSVKFNLERGDRSKLKGHETDVRILKDFKDWAKLDDAMKDRVVDILTNPNFDPAEMREKLLGGTGLAPGEADAILEVDLPSGYVRFSRKAIDKLLPHLEKGMILMGKADTDASAMHEAGYLRRDELQRRLFERLPSLSTIRSGPLADLPNPVVRAALHELRRVVNAIIREYGLPAAVHIEMARSMKMGGEARREYNKRVQDRGRERDAIAEKLRNAKIAPTRDAVTKYRLWQEQGEKCLYTGASISFHQLFDGATDIDHILPYSKTLDDSQMNKVVCFRDANREKGQRSPYEWLAGADPKRLEAIEQRAKFLPWNKQRKLSQREIKTDDFIERQLVDTGYIARLAVAYLEMLVANKHDVQGRKGTYTADLRHQWGLSNLLHDLPDSPAWQEKLNLAPGEKNRADHRHHALDAIVIALTSRKTLAAMHQGRETVSHVDTQTGDMVEHQRFTREIPPPWGMDSTEFRRMVLERLSQVNVSHRVRRKVRGALHQDTLYGPVHNHKGSAEQLPGTFVVRKAVESLSPNEVAKIRDKAIRDIVTKQLTSAGITLGRGADKVPPKKMQEALAGLKMPSGVPIKRVRILVENATVTPIRKDRPGEAWVIPGSTHHICIFEWTETDRKGQPKRVRDAIFVTMLEAIRRTNKHEPLIQRTHPQRPDAKFVMSLSSGELVLAKIKGCEIPILLTYKTAAATTQQLLFALHTDARRSGDQKKFSATPNTLDARKITIDPLGRIRWAND